MSLLFDTSLQRLLCLHSSRLWVIRTLTDDSKGHSTLNLFDKLPQTGRTYVVHGIRQATNFATGTLRYLATNHSFFCSRALGQPPAAIGPALRVFMNICQPSLYSDMVNLRGPFLCHETLYISEDHGNSSCPIAREEIPRTGTTPSLKPWMSRMSPFSRYSKISCEQRHCDLLCHSAMDVTRLIVSEHARAVINSRDLNLQKY